MLLKPISPITFNSVQGAQIEQALGEHSAERMPCASTTRERIAAFAVASGDHNPVQLDATSPKALYLTDEVGHLRIKGYTHVTR